MSRGPCKFGARCTRRGCWHDHPPGEQSNPQGPRGPSQALPRQKPPRGPCRAGAACTRGSSCILEHPERSQLDNQASTSQPAAPAARSAAASQVRCRFGAGCRYKATCKFDHSGDGPAPPSEEAPRRNYCTARVCDGYCGMDHKRSCRHGLTCIRKDCRYSHIVSARAPSALVPALTSIGEAFDDFELRHPKVCKPSLKVDIRKGLVAHFKSVSSAQAAAESAAHSPPARLQTAADITAFIEAKVAVVTELENQAQSFVHSVTVALARFSPSSDSEQEAMYAGQALRGKLRRELFRLCPPDPAKPLPALGCRLEFEEAVRDHPVVVVKGATGSGKSTQLPAYVADMPEFQGKVLVTQPRKVAAESLARRVGYEFAAGHEKGQSVGGYVGFRVGGRRKCSKFTRIEYVTEAVLLHELASDPSRALSTYDAIVIDEAHERSITCDLLLGILKTAVKEGRCQAKVVVTSATIDTALFSSYFDGAPVLSIPGRTFPVDVVYTPVVDITKNLVKSVVTEAVRIIQDSGPTSGDVLAFLTGQAEVESAVKLAVGMLQVLQIHNVTPMCLYGSQLPEDQEKVFEQPPPGMRRLIFATNVAETSVTIDGVRHVIDSGLSKEMRYDHRRNMSVLEVASICQSSAIQRSGRAGRTAPGTCYRLYSEADFYDMDLSPAPEILCSPLRVVFLELVAMNIDAVAFDWLQHPGADAFTSARNDLIYLDALETDAHSRLQVTEFGRICAGLRKDPCIVRTAYCGATMGMARTGARLAGILTTADRIFWSGNTPELKAAAAKKRDLFESPLGDVVTAFRVFSEWIGVGDSANSETGSQVSGTTDVLDELPEMDAAEVAAAVEEAGLAGRLGAEDTYDEFDYESGDDVASVNSEFSEGAWSDDGSDAEGWVGDEVGSEADGAASDFDSFSVAPTDDSRDDDNGRGVADDRGYRANKRVVDRARRRWCVDNSLNNKSLSIAQSEAREIERALTDAGLFNISSEPSVTDEDVVFMFVSGFFANIAYSGLLRPGDYMSPSADLAGVLSYSSHLAKVSPAPEWIVFQTTLTTKRTLFLTATVLTDVDIVRRAAPVWAEKFLDRYVNERPVAAYLPRLHGSVMRQVIGKGRDAISQLEDELGVRLQANYEFQELTVFGSREAVDNAVGILKERAKQAVADIREEVVVAEIEGGHGVFAAGGKVVTLVLPGECIEVSIGNLPPTATEEQIAEMIRVNATGEPAVERRRIQLYTTGRDANSKLSARVMLSTAAEAKAVIDLNDLPVFPDWDEAVSVRPSRKLMAARTFEEDYKLEVIWATGVSTGSGRVVFENEEAAAAAVARPPPGIRVKAKTRVVRGVPQYCVYANDINTQWDEEHLAGMFASYGAVKFTEVYRRDSTGGRSGFSSEVSSSLLEDIALLRQIGGAGDNSATQTSSVERRSKRSSFTVRFPSAELARQSYEPAQSRATRLRLFHGQPIRVQLTLTMTINIHAALYNARKDAFDAIVADFWLSRHTHSAEVREPPASRARSANSWVKMTFETRSAEDLSRVRAQLAQQVATRVFRHEKVRGLFSRTGRSLLLATADAFLAGVDGAEPVHLHWDARVKTVSLIGDLRSIEIAHSVLIATVNSFFEESGEKEFPIPSGAVRAVRRMCGGLRKLDGVAYARLSVSPPGDTRPSILTVHASVDVLEEIQLRVDKVIQAAPEAVGVEDDEERCPLCYMRVLDESDTCTLVLCSHTYHVECLEPQLSQRPPLVCLASDGGKCGTPLAVRDIQFIGAADVSECWQRAAADFLGRSDSGFTNCLTPDCTGIRGPGSETSFSCPVCCEEYCPACTERNSGEGSVIHPNRTCQEYRLDPNNHRMLAKGEMEDALTLRRPCCGRPVIALMWTGCAAVACDCPSSGHFCGLCLAACTSSSCHSHVKACSFNDKATSNYHPSPAAYHAAHKKQQETALVERIQTLRETVADDVILSTLDEIESELADLNIRPEAILRRVGM